MHVYRCDWCGFWHIGHDVGRFTTPVPSAAKLRRKVEAVGAQIAADDRRWMQEQTRRAEQEARHREEMAEPARDHAEVLAEIERLVDEDLRQRKAGK